MIICFLIFLVRLPRLISNICSVSLDKRMVNLLQNWWVTFKVTHKKSACIENRKGSGLLYKKSKFPRLFYNLLTAERLVLHCFQKRQNTVVRAALVSVISHLRTRAITRQTLSFLEIFPVVTRESFHWAWVIDGRCEISDCLHVIAGDYPWKRYLGII